AEGSGPVAGRTAVAVVEAEIDVGRTRTMQEDVDFGLRQMTDVALRALSPAINDPTTAVEVVLRLGSVLSRMLAAEPAPNAVLDDQGRTVVRDWELDPAEYVGHAFDQIRLACVRHPAVCMAVLRTLRMLRGVAEEHGRSGVVPALQQQAELLLDQVDRTARTTADMTETDRARIHDAADAATDNPHHGCYAAPRRTAAVIQAK
nr:DUF2254 family protein [Micromonospora sp. DSM 115978]